MSTTGASSDVRAERAPRSTRTVVVVGVVISLLLAGLVSSYASSHPDGLEYVGQSLGFGESARDSAVAGSPLADYAVSGVDDARLSGGLAGVVGVLVTGVLMAGVLLLVRRSSRRRR